MTSVKVKLKGQGHVCAQSKVKVTIFSQWSMEHYIPTIDYKVQFMYIQVDGIIYNYTKLYIVYNFQVEILSNCDHVLVFLISQ